MKQQAIRCNGEGRKQTKGPGKTFLLGGGGVGGKRKPQTGTSQAFKERKGERISCSRKQEKKVNK